MARKIYHCFECGKRIIPTSDGFWRHARKPIDGHKPSPNISQHDKQSINKESIKLAGDIISYGIDPTAYAIKKTIDFGCCGSHSATALTPFSETTYTA